MDKLDPVWFLYLSPLYLTSNNQVQSPRPERCKDIGLEVTNTLCVQIKVSKLCQSSLHIDHNWIYSLRIGMHFIQFYLSRLDLMRVI